MRVLLEEPRHADLGIAALAVGVVATKHRLIVFIEHIVQGEVDFGALEVRLLRLPVGKQALHVVAVVGELVPIAVAQRTDRGCS